MAVLAQTILTRVRTQLIDELTTKRWSDDELLRWMSDAERTLIAMDPALGEKTAPTALVPGSKQRLPDDAFMLLDIKCNTDATGSEMGRVVTVVTRENLDAVDPNWHASRRSDTVFHYIYDPKQPLTFYCWPPSTGASYVDMSAAYSPPPLTALNQPITVPDLYQTAIFDYTMFRAHQKDTDYAAGNDKAQMYLGLFQMFTTSHTAAVLDESPNKQLGGTDLSDKGAAA